MCSSAALHIHNYLLYKIWWSTESHTSSKCIVIRLSKTDYWVFCLERVKYLPTLCAPVSFQLSVKVCCGLSALLCSLFCYIYVPATYILATRGRNKDIGPIGKWLRPQLTIPWWVYCLSHSFEVMFNKTTGNLKGQCSCHEVSAMKVCEVPG